MKAFLALWEQVKEANLGYGQNESWEKFQATGQALLEKFLQEELSRIGNVTAAERAFELRITSLDLPFVGVIDLIADVDGKHTVVDFKRVNAGYQEHEVVLSDHLTAYQLAEAEAQQAALCVLVETKEPKIERHVAARSGEDLVEFLIKADIVARSHPRQVLAFHNWFPPPRNPDSPPYSKYRRESPFPWHRLESRDPPQGAVLFPTTPCFLNSPISSFFLVSTLATGLP